MMISEEDQDRILEAQKCETCPEWHKHCKAECCKIVYLKIDPQRLKGHAKYLNMRVSGTLSLSERRYYRLRDVPYIRGVLRFQKDRILVAGGKIMYIYPCKLLDDNLLCKGHPDDKPEICRKLTKETAWLPGQPFKLTDNCLFKYK